MCGAHPGTSGCTSTARMMARPEIEVGNWIYLAERPCLA